MHEPNFSGSINWQILSSESKKLHFLYVNTHRSITISGVSLFAMARDNTMLLTMQNIKGIIFFETNKSMAMTMFFCSWACMLLLFDGICLH